MVAVVAAGVACEKPSPPKPSAPASKTGAPAASDAKPTASPPPAGARTLDLQGISFTVPEGWTTETPPSGPMAPVAVFRLPKAEDDAEDASVRITHFREMKGMDEMNLTRWIGQMSRPDGAPATRDDAKISTVQAGGARVTIVDIRGTLTPGMMGGGVAKPKARMVAAIVDHPQGPHFVKAEGGEASIEKWHASIQAFLLGAKTNETK